MLAGCLVASPAAAQLFRWTDADGTVHYTADPASIPPAHRDGAQRLGHPQARPEPPAPVPGTVSIAVDPRAPITVAAHLNGVPLTLIVDTGAERTVISPSAIARAGFAGQGGQPIRIVGATGMATATLLTVPLLDVAGARIGPLTVVVHALPPDARAESVDGLLGRDVLGAFTLAVDPTSGRATLTPR